MSKFFVDAYKLKVVKVFQKLGFQIVREKEHISMIRINLDGTETPLTMPITILLNHLRSELFVHNQELVGKSF